MVVTGKRKMNPLYSKINIKRAIRSKCFECSGNSYKDIALCTVTSCALWPYREITKEKTSLEEEEIYEEDDVD